MQTVLNSFTHPLYHTFTARSGLVVRLPAAREYPGSNRAAGTKVECFSSRYAALGTGCTLTAVPRSTQPSTLRGTVNEYQPHGSVIIPMVMRECSAYSSLLQAHSKVKFAA